MKKNASRLCNLTNYLKLTHFIRIMKVTSFLIFAVIFQLAASNADAQNAKINISKSVLSLHELISEIEKQTDYLFVYEEAEINISKQVRVNARNKPVDDILKQAFSDGTIIYEFANNYISLRTLAGKEILPVQQQEKKRITGVVSDEYSDPVIGASVVEKGTTNGIVTDMNGHFAINVPEDGVLTISYIGYVNQETPVKGRMNLSIILMEDTKALEEVVVVGFGSQKKVNLTGAVSTVSSETFKERPVQNATLALQGMIPGLNISKGVGTLDKAPDIDIRGMTTIGEGSTGSPLILIDGTEGDINMLNPQDIESVTVLKDAAASSIYGSRAPFGVILVKTKNGSKDKFNVNYNNSFRWSQPAVRPNVVDSYRFATYFNDAATNGRSTGKFTPERLQRIRDYMDEKITTVNIPDPNNPANWADGYDYANANIDWYDEMYNQWAFSSENTVTMSGGTEKIQMYASVNYLDMNGMIKVSDDTYGRFSTNLKTTIQPTDYLDVNISMRYSSSDYDRPARFGELDKLGYQTWPMLPVYDDNGYLFNSPSPIIYLRDGGRDKTKNEILTQQLQFVLRPLKGWDIIGEVNYRINRNRNHWDLQKVYNHNVAGDIIPNNSNTEVRELSYSNDYINPNIYSTYERAFNHAHNVKVMAGFQSESSKVNEFTALRNGVVVPYMDVIDATNGTDGSGKSVPPSVSGKREEWLVAGFFGRLNYDYKERYLLEVNYRYDGSSRFRSDKRWKSFPSVSVGWNIARESFWENYTPHVSTLKLRASYGVLGNQNTEGWYPTYVTMPIGTSNSGWLINNAKQNTASAPGLISSVLTWETIESVNFGIDADLLKNRLNISFDAYQRDTKDMIGPAPEMPAILGVEVPKTNNTDLRTKGWELSVKWRDRIGKDWSYNVAFNVSDSKTKITRYPNETFNLEKHYTGQTMGDIWGYETVGIAKTQEEMDAHLASLPNGGQTSIGSDWGPGDIMYKDLNGDGVINRGAYTLYDHGDMKVIGNNTPRYRFGLNLGASWKRVDFSAFFQGVMKRDFWQGDWNFWGYTGYIWRSTAYEQHMDYFRNDPDHYMGLNQNSYYPRPVDNSSKNQQVQSRYLQNGAYIRLKNLQVGYSMPKPVLSKIGISHLRLFLSGENLWVGTNLSKIFDPEALGWGNGSIGYPISRTYSFGLSVSL